MTTPQERAIAERAEIVTAATLAAREAFSSAGLCARIGRNARHRRIMAGEEDHSLQTEILAAEIAISKDRSRLQELEHYHRYFVNLAKVNAAANAALDTARREWEKRGDK